jgi:Secretion system C-terminal sorting domain
MKNFIVQFTIFIFFFFIQLSFAQKQIIINELSQGPNDDWEWIEYIVLENGTDIRGVYLDDNDVLHGTLGSAKLVQLKTDLPAFENVSKGSIIVIYKSPDSTWFNGQDPKLFEAGAPDTDFSDGIIIIPHTNTEFLEAGSWWPNFRSDGENLGIFDDTGVGIFGMSYGNESPEGDFTNGWGMVDLVDIPYTGVGFYYGTTVYTASDSTYWLMGVSTLGTPGTTNLGQGDVPVELVSFSAIYRNTEILLSWETATENNNYGFEIEKSFDQVSWDKIGFVKGNGNSTENISYLFTDTDIDFSSTYFYRLKQIDFNGTFVYSNVVEINPVLVESFKLEQNYPNPFNPSTTIRFSLPNKSFVSLKVYTSLGEELETLHDGILEAGIYSFSFNADNLPSGIYIYKLAGENNTQVRKMMLLK